MPFFFSYTIDYIDSQKPETYKLAGVLRVLVLLFTPGNFTSTPLQYKMFHHIPIPHSDTYNGWCLVQWNATNNVRLAFLYCGLGYSDKQ